MAADISGRPWKLSVASRTELSSWVEAARRLRAVLEAISEKVQGAYGQPVTWISTSLDAAGWADVERIAETMERLINTDDEGRVWHKLGALGGVQGYLDGRSLIDLTWGARDHEVPMHCHADFETPTSEGVARPLADHDPAWLGGLLLAVSQPMVRVMEARVYNRAWQRALRARGIRHARSIGAISYSPHPIDPDALPDTLTIAAQAEHGTAIAVRDLRRFASDPASLLDDLLELDRLIAAVKT